MLTTSIGRLSSSSTRSSGYKSHIKEPGINDLETLIIANMTSGRQPFCNFRREELGIQCIPM
jgi:hypothetical protein